MRKRLPPSAMFSSLHHPRLNDARADLGAEGTQEQPSPPPHSRQAPDGEAHEAPGEAAGVLAGRIGGALAAVDGLEYSRGLRGLRIHRWKALHGAARTSMCVPV